MAVRVKKVATSSNNQLWKCNKNQIWSNNNNNNKTYTFDKVFNPNEDTLTVYKELVSPIMDNFVQGFNATIFAYGQTASGKPQSSCTTYSRLRLIMPPIYRLIGIKCQILNLNCSIVERTEWYNRAAVFCSVEVAQKFSLPEVCLLLYTGLLVPSFYRSMTSLS